MWHHQLLVDDVSNVCWLSRMSTLTWDIFHPVDDEGVRQRNLPAITLPKQKSDSPAITAHNKCHVKNKETSLLISFFSLVELAEIKAASQHGYLHFYISTTTSSSHLFLFPYGNQLNKAFGNESWRIFFSALVLTIGKAIWLLCTSCCCCCWLLFSIYISLYNRRVWWCRISLFFSRLIVVFLEFSLDWRQYFVFVVWLF